MKKFNIRAYLRGVLRKAFLQAPIKTQVLQSAKCGERGRMYLYQCAACPAVITRNECQVDHLIPVTPLVGFDDWNGFIERMFCDPGELQVLCKPCHKKKTLAENIERRKHGAGPHGKKAIDSRTKKQREKVSAQPATIKATNLKTGKEISFSTPGAAARRLKLDVDNIRKCLKDRRIRVGGWRFEALPESAGEI